MGDLGHPSVQKIAQKCLRQEQLSLQQAATSRPSSCPACLILPAATSPRRARALSLGKGLSHNHSACCIRIHRTPLGHA